MQEVDIETVKQTLNSYLSEHLPKYRAVRYHNQLRLFIEPVKGGDALAQYVHTLELMLPFRVVKIDKNLERVLQVFCLLHDITYNARTERGPADDENYALRS